MNPRNPLEIILLAKEYHDRTGTWPSREYIENIDLDLRDDVLELENRIEYYEKGGAAS